ncbi:MAG: peptidoglycan-binding domain-containing protein [Hyphomicrobiales bacterium]
MTSESVNGVIDDVPARIGASAFLTSALVAALWGAILYNVLYLQEGVPGSGDQTSSLGSTHLTVEAPSDAAPAAIVVRVDPMVEAVQRELALSGFYTGPVDGLPGRRTKTAIVAYQNANALDPTGEANQELVDHIRLTREIVAASGMTDEKGVPQSSDPIRRVQMVLSELGYLPGTIDGFLGEQTRDAIRQFERDRHLPITGDVTEALMAELAKTSGTSQTQTP